MRRRQHLRNCSAVLLTVAALVIGGLPWTAVAEPVRARPSAGASTTASAQDVFTVYMTPRSKGGSDTNDGRTPQTGVITLLRVEQILRQAKPTTDVWVRITQGDYYTNPYVWKFYVPGHTITFAPIDYDPGDGGSDIAGRPRFRNPGANGGSKPSGYWLHPQLPEDPGHPLYNGGTMGLRFYYLTINCYNSGGISLDGDTGRDVRDETYDPPLRQPGSQGHNGNTVFGVVFDNIGSECLSGTEQGYGGMVLTNSSHNRIENNHFQHFEDEGPSRVHGMYITHFSSHNRIRNNRFTDVSGQGLKLRDRSNYHDISGNTFTQSGWYAYYYGQYCNLACVNGPGAGKARECASYGNQFTGNNLVSDHNNGNAEEYVLDPPGQTNAGEDGCTIPSGEQRVHASGNT